MAPKGKKPTVEFVDAAAADLSKVQDELTAQIEKLEQRAQAVMRQEEDERKRRLDSQRLEDLLVRADEEKKAAVSKPQPRDHEARELQGREFSEREMYQRRFFKGGNIGKLWVDPSDIPADEIWYYAAKEIMGEDNLRHLNTLFYNGWQIVRPHEAPSACKIHDYAEELGQIQSKSAITVDASILLKRKKWIHEMQMDSLLQEQRKAENDAISLTNQMGDQYTAPTQMKAWDSD